MPLSFGDFELDQERRQLLRSGHPVSLEPKAYELLILLVERRPRVLSRAQIRDVVWPGVYISESTLNQSVNAIRQALDDDARRPRFIRTAHGFGYAFCGEARDATDGHPGLRTARELESSPYPGLRAFTGAEADVFFGREVEVKALWEKVQRQKLLAVIGPSGVGKTSFLRAGVMPSRPEGWASVCFTPGSSPFFALAHALTPELAGDAEALEELFRGAEDLSRGGESSGLHSAITRWRGKSDHALLVVDQLEELFTLNLLEAQRRFAHLLGGGAEADVHVLLSVRDDFLFRCGEHENLRPVFHDLTPLYPPAPEALRRALVEPAARLGFRFEDGGLVDEMLETVEGERGALPLLAFAVSRVWEGRDQPRKLLTRATYHALGGVSGALSQHAEATLDRIGTSRVPLVRELFRNLVTAQGTRAVRGREELLSVFETSGRRGEAEEVVGALVDARLLTSYEREGEGGETHQQVEIIHESLLQAWPRLVRWRTQDADGAQLRDQLRQAAQLWEAKGRSPDLLWTGSAYQEFRLWRERYPGNLTALEADYARSMVDRAQRRKRLLRLAIGTAFVVTTAVAIAIGLSRQQALRALDRAEASRLLAIGELRLRDDPTEALAFATASLARSDSEEARVFAIKALWEAPPAIEAVASAQNSRNLDFSPDGEWLAAGGFAADAHVWSDDGLGPLVLAGVVSPQGGIVPKWASNDLLVTGSEGNAGSQVHLWSVPEGRRLRTVDFGSPSYWSVGSRRLLVESDAPDSSSGALLREWAIPDGEPVVLGRGVPMPGATWTFFAPDGRSWFYVLNRDVYARPLPGGAGRARLVTRLGADLAVGLVWNDPDRFVVGDQSGRIQTWSLDAERPAPERSLQKPASATLVVPEPSGRWLRGDASADQLVRVWDLAAWRAARPLTLRRNLSWYVAQTAFHPSGDWVVASTARATRLTFWPLKRSYPAIVDGYFTGINRPVAFSPDSRWLVTSWADRRLRLWPVTDRGLAEPRTLDPAVPPGNWRSMKFDPKGRYVFAVGGMSQAWVFPLDGSPVRRLDCPVGGQLNSAAVSPSGRRVATAFSYGKGPARLCAWDLETGERRQFDLPESERAASTASPVRTGYEQGAFHLAFADENRLFTAGDGGLRLWDLDTGSHEIVAKSAPGYALLASWSADARVAVTAETWPGRFDDCRRALLHDLANRAYRPLTQFGPCGDFQEVGQLDASGTVAVTGGRDGIARVGRLSGGQPHLLLGHKGVVDRVAVSPDLRWVATSGEDNTLRLWPMPDLSKPPLHTLPHGELLAKLRSLTNLRVVRDAASGEGWRLEVGPFPGWKTIPEW